MLRNSKILGIFIPVHMLLMLAGQLSDGAFRIPFYQQLSSKNSSLLPTWSSSWEGSKSSNQGWKFHDPLASISELLLARI